MFSCNDVYTQKRMKQQGGTKAKSQQLIDTKHGSMLMCLHFLLFWSSVFSVA